MRDMAALYTLLTERAAMPFAWGNRANDCVSFAAAAIEAQTGYRAMLAGRGWSTALGAARALTKAGGIVAAVDAQFRRVDPPFAQRGDIAAIAAGDGRSMLLAIVEGDTLVGPGPNGLERMPRAAIMIAWSAE